VKPDTLPYYLQKCREKDVVVEFDEGDRYAVSVLDITYVNDDDEWEISVSFADCLGPSRAYARAVQEGPKERSPGVWWTSTRPHQPVGRTYSPGEVKTVWDRKGRLRRQPNRPVGV